MNVLGIRLAKSAWVRPGAAGFRRICLQLGVVLIGAVGLPSQAAINCQRQVTADIVAFDKPLTYNRLGASNVNGMMFALRRDVINASTQLPLVRRDGGAVGAPTPGQLDLRPDKRHRPLVLRVRVGDCLTVKLTNLLTVQANPENAPQTLPNGQRVTVFIDEQIRDRAVSFHATGLQLVDTIDSDGSFVGRNANDGFAPPAGGTRTYRLFAEKEGAYAVTGSAPIGSDGNQGNTSNGLFGQVIVEPPGARIYRSQVMEEDLRLAADVNRNGVLDAAELTTNRQPKLGNNCVVGGTAGSCYEARYPLTAPWTVEGKSGLPILNMLLCSSATSCEVVHSETSAVIAGPNADGTFPPSTYPLERVGRRNPSVPNRLEPFRDFAQVWHDEVAAAQAFPGFFDKDPVFRYVLAGVRDAFMINYGSGGIGAEIIANRLGVGPMHDCLSCAYEEFFLSSFAVGDPAITVDVPANLGLEHLLPGQKPPKGTLGPKANYVIGAEDPSNVHHSYVGDFVKFRHTHIGKEQHVFHLHNHQWLFNPNDDNSNYIDAQGIGPGAGYTYEIAFGGSGNRNKTAGDAIFHCHFYPHFAQGMWYHWRINDTYESGSVLAATPARQDSAGFAVADGYHAKPWELAVGKPRSGARAYPDGEIVAGVPIPAVVPLPGKPMPVMPGRATTKPNPLASATNPSRPVGSLARVIDRNIHPGFPFAVAGMEDLIGQRPPTPNLDMITPAKAAALKSSGDPLWTEIQPAQADGFDGGLPRHGLRGYAAGGVSEQVLTRLDFSKEIKKADAVFYPEEGTDLEKVSMAFHAQRCVPSFRPDGTPASCTTDALRGPVGGFILNGGKPVIGAPYQNPCMDDSGQVMRAGTVGRFFSGEEPKGMSTRGASIFHSDAPRVYKGTNIQFDAVFNKVGYHYPQQRILTLWQDVFDVITKAKAPEPLVMRLNTFDCAIYHHSNLVPEFYEIDDYQIRTPTDIIGQHIHLPKWDLTTADGAGNGWNYEDGTVSPRTVRSRIKAINCFNGYADACAPGVTAGKPNGKARLEAKAHPYWGKVAARLDAAPGGVSTQRFGAEWLGARTTTQRWFADPVVNVDGVDRGLGIIFTHDHYGASTHQQVGLYATVLTQPAGARWAHNETGQQLGYDPTTGAAARTDSRTDGSTFSDGGPTSWQAAIMPQPQTGAYAANTVRAGPCDSATQVTGVDCQRPFREFFLEYSDFQHAYEAGVYVGADQRGMPFQPDGLGLPPSTFNAGNPQWDGRAQNAFRFVINPPGRKQINPVFPDLVLEIKDTLNDPLDNFCPVRPCPQAIDVQDPGMFVVNYRQEPVGLRVYDPKKIGPDGKPGMQAEGLPGDLAFALQSRKDRLIPELNVMPGAGTVINGTRFTPHVNTGRLEGGDPYTPTLRVYNGDLVRVKIQAGAHEEEHNASIHGLKWLQGGSGHGRAPNSGWRNNQPGGIAEQFTLSAPVLPADKARSGAADYAYSLDGSHDGWWNGVWGVLRSYETLRQDLFKLPGALSGPATLANTADFNGICPVGAPARNYDVTAVRANRVLGNAVGATLLPTGPVATQHVGSRPDPAGGTLVYNSRNTTVTGTGIDPATGALATLTRQGPLHDPTALMYVMTADLDANGRLKPGAPVEPLVLRAQAGDCINVTLRNRLGEGLVASNSNSATNDPSASGASTLASRQWQLAAMPELATYSTLAGVVKRDRLNPQGSTTFNNNLIRSSSYAGLHPQLLAYDVTQHDGVLVGLNADRGQVARVDGKQVTYRWYAGDISGQPQNGSFVAKATPLEFGGVNLIPADKVKQGAKSLVGTLVVGPLSTTPGTVTTWSENTPVANRQGEGGTRSSRTQATVCPNQAPGSACTMAASGAFRDFSAVLTKANTHYWRDGTPVEHMNGEGVGVPEDSQGSSGMALNYGIEPLWFRFGILPQAPFGHAGVRGSYGDIPNAHLAYSNRLLTGSVTCTGDLCTGDPQTPVFVADAGREARLQLTTPFGTSRGSTFVLHGHHWQRDPYICPGQSRLNLRGACSLTGAGSLAIGDNPLGFAMGGLESWNAVTHFTVRLPSAGGQQGIRGDYLMRDQASLGSASGIWSIVRVK